MAYTKNQHRQIIFLLLMIATGVFMNMRGDAQVIGALFAYFTIGYVIIILFKLFIEWEPKKDDES